MSGSLPPTVTRPTDCCSSSCDDVVVSQVPGPAGAAGAAGTNGTNGVSAFTTTTAQYTQPAVGNNVTIAVTNSTWAAIGEPIFVSVGGSYLVVSKPDSTHIEIQNLGYTGNAAPASIVATSQIVTPSGIKGDTGSAGAGTLNALSPTTTKGDIIADNGANSPSASNVRLGVGTDGQQLTAVAAQPTGLQWKTLIPNSTFDNGIPRFDGTAGTPVPLQTSGMLISDTGALQSTPTAGNARGTSAVDLQVTRSVGTAVASGTNSVVAGGENNTASASHSTVSGGRTNVASGQESSVSGGFSNTASAAQSAVMGGTGNAASGQYSMVAAGSSNTASGVVAAVAGGNNNLASGQNAFIGGGQNNTASALYSAVVGGSRSLASLEGQVAHSGGMFAAAGDSQTSVLVARNNTTDATPTLLFLDGSAVRLTITDDTTWAFRVMVVARRTDANDESAAYEFVGCMDRNVGVGTTALVGSVTKVVVAEDTAAWDANITADAVNGALSITVTGEAAKAIQWTARIEITQTTG